MKVICNRSDECGDYECEHQQSHERTSGIGGCGHQECRGDFVKCIEDTAHEVKPIRFELIE